MFPITWEVKAIGLVLALSALLLGLWRFVSSERAVGASQAIAECNKNTVEQAKKYSDYQLQTQKELTDVQIKATTDVANSRAAALDAVQSSKRLQQRIDALVSQAAHSASSPTPSTPTSDSVGLLADVLRRSSERSRLLADYADQARIAGLACEASYDALNPDPKDYANKSKN